MQLITIFTLILFGVFYFSEGKPCPEKTRPHKTRCEAYYKCTELPRGTHVWVPTICERGLVYEHNLGICVLPADDWECTLGDPIRSTAKITTTMATTTTTAKIDNKLSSSEETGQDVDDLYVLSQEEDDNDDGVIPLNQRVGNDAKVELVVDSNMSSEEDEEMNKNVAGDEDNPYEASGDGGDDNGDVGVLMHVGDGFLQAENRETDDELPVEKPIKYTHQMQKVMKQDDAGLEEIHMEPSQTSTKTTTIDPNLTAHLQRLSQLIDGLKESYQLKDEKQTDLRPDQLNAFLAHFNILNNYEALDPLSATKMASSSSTTSPTTTTTTTTTSTSTTTESPLPSLSLSPWSRNPARGKNKTISHQQQQQQLQLLSQKMRPETKVVLTSSIPTAGGGSYGYSNSQIVVNRPEGSVTFSLPSYSAESSEFNHPNAPKISEDTLNRVLELSKQMIDNQHVPKVIPNPSFYPQPILQPVYLPAAAFPGAMGGSPFSSFYEPNEQKYTKTEKQRPHHHRPNGGQKPQGTTIIHNNVIPVHVNSGAPLSTSAEKEFSVDSYGHAIHGYPPLDPGDGGNYKGSGYQSSQAVNHIQTHHSYENSKYTMSTTMRPFLVASSTTPTPMPSNGYGSVHYPSPSPYGVSEMQSGTTPRPPFEFQPSPATIAEYYTPTPHLNENNVNSIFQPNEKYPTIQYGNIPRPMDLNRPQSNGGSGGGYQQMERPYPSQGQINSLFPAQIDVNKVKIRPNSHKIESMEVENDEYSGGIGSFSGQPQQQVMTYNYNGHDNSDRPDSVNQQQLSQLSSSSMSSYGNSNKNPLYMPRPSSGLSGGVLNIGGGGGGSSYGHSKPNYPTHSHGYKGHGGSGGGGDGQLVNFGGNFISYDVFQNTILPLLNQSPTSGGLPDVEVINCAPGVRQPNITDCTRYYVCSKKDGKVLSYSCPPYTAFNAQTRICDAHTYSICSPEAVLNSFTIAENKRIQMEALKALNEAKKRREQAQKAQSISQLLQQFNGEPSGSGGFSGEKGMLSSYMQQAAAMSQSQAMGIGGTVSSGSGISSSGGISSVSGNLMEVGASSTMRPPSKKRKYYCKEGDKVPDQTSIYSYFVCFKNAQGQMKGHKMTCSKGLLFCPMTSMCTLPSKCS